MSVSATGQLTSSGPSTPTLDRGSRPRSARLVPHRSVHAVLQHVVHDVLTPGWKPRVAAQHLAEAFADDTLLLRQARLRVREAAATDRMTLVHARAIATLNLAITDVADRGTATTALGAPYERRASGGAGGGRSRGR